ncbi:MAG: alpha/beta fold hydrolase [Isosphaeraceae bacterium]|nr:alpha/beta fold hydrolase [Isosphaeraceae bacterium]
MNGISRFAIAVLACVSLAGTETWAAGDGGQSWEGSLKVLPGVDLRLVLHVQERENGVLTASLDSPDQGAKDLKIDTVIRDKTRLVFELKGLAAKFEGKLNDAGTEAKGTWTQGGNALPLTLKKKDTAIPEPKIVGAEQFWEGKLPIGPGLSYRLVLRVSKTDNGGLVAQLDSPDEGFRGLKVEPITLDAKRLRFELKVSGARYEGTLNASGTEAVGEWAQASAKVPLTFKKTDRPSVVRRPQTPKPPFPYKAEAVVYQNVKGGVTLAGTLTKPQGAGPFPAVILISGSGAQDRDETIFQHKPFFVLADALTRRGLAVLRVDDRGVGGSTGSTAKATSNDFAEDVLAGVAYLKTRPEIAARKIGLIGHSEGGLIAPLVATRSDDVAFIVLMAGTGLPGDEIILMQARLLAQALGAGGDGLDRRMEIQKQLLQIAKTEPDDPTALAKMRETARGRAGANNEQDAKAENRLDARLEGQFKAMRSPWYRHFLAYDPRPALAHVRCPVLALVGEKDLQVPPKENLSAIEKALKESGNTSATVKELPGLNHLFQTCRTGSTAEYAEIEETIAPAALELIGSWVESHAKGR